MPRDAQVSVLLCATPGGAAWWKAWICAVEAWRRSTLSEASPVQRRAAPGWRRLSSATIREPRDLLDGGLADNPRHALYGVDYSALVVGRPTAAPEVKVCLAGPYCESGDVLSMDLPLSRVEPGDLLAVPVSGAYQLSMASNYNLASRPAVLWLEKDAVEVLQRRERVAGRSADPVG